MVTILYNNGNKKTVHFGATGYSDYTKHKDKERMNRYNIRHKSRENWGKSGIGTAGFWSKWILWNKPSFGGSVSDTARRFNIIIKRSSPPNAVKIKIRSRSRRKSRSRKRSSSRRKSRSRKRRRSRRKSRSRKRRRSRRKSRSRK
jgi:hypothetical protein